MASHSRADSPPLGGLALLDLQGNPLGAEGIEALRRRFGGRLVL